MLTHDKRTHVKTVRSMLRLPFYLIFIVLSFAIGCSIPAFYEWSGADQSRSPPVLGYTALALVSLGASVCLALPWLPAASAGSVAPSTTIRFNIRTLLIATAACALVLAALMKFPLVVSGALYLVALFSAIWIAIVVVERRGQTIALLATLYLPFSWIITTAAEWHISPTTLLLSMGLPALLPTLLIGSWTGHPAHSISWLSLLLTSLALLNGIFIIRIGPRLVIAYLVLILLVATFGSFVLNALVRM